MLHQVYGGLELHIPQDEDVGTKRCHHRGLVDRARGVERVEHAEALALDEALIASLEKLVNEDLDSSAKHAGNFEAAEQTKEVPLDPAAPEGKALRVGSTLDRNRKWCLSTFSAPTPTLLTVKIRQPSHEFTFGVGMSFILYPLVLTPVV
jgi:hypothetical protein